MIRIKNRNDILGIAESCRIVAEILDEMENLIKPGVTTLLLNNKADEILKKNNAKSAFKGYSLPGLTPYPGSICTSINSCIVHGIPRATKILMEGDIIGIDVGVVKNGYYGDAARTFRVGKVSSEVDKLLEVTKTALEIGMAQAQPNNFVGDISWHIGSYVSEQGYYVAERLTGHGVGLSLHEEPMIPNEGKKKTGARLKKGMTIAIEPMVNIGTGHVYEKEWEFFAADNSLSAHFENSILITDNGPVILTATKDLPEFAYNS